MLTILAIAIITVFVLTASAAAKRPTHSPGYLAAVQLNRGLAGTPMRSTGFALVAVAKRYRLNPALIAGIAGTESSYGAAACSNNPRNAFGLSSCGSGWRVPYFASWRSAYEFMGRFLTSRWPRARTPWEFYGYAANSQTWGSHTARHMAELGFSTSTRWPG